MSSDCHKQAKIIVEYLDTLIREIEENPDISPWVIRQVIKAAHKKAEKLVDDLKYQESNHKTLSHSRGYYSSTHR